MRAGTAAELDEVDAMRGAQGRGATEQEKAAGVGWWWRGVSVAMRGAAWGWAV